MIEEEHRDFFVRLLADINGTMDAIARLVPIRLARGDSDAMRLATISVLDRESIAAHGNRDPMIRVAVPRCSLAWGEMESSNERRSAPIKHLLGHLRFPENLAIVSPA